MKLYLVGVWGLPGAWYTVSRGASLAAAASAAIAALSAASWAALAVCQLLLWLLPVLSLVNTEHLSPHLLGPSLPSLAFQVLLLSSLSSFWHETKQIRVHYISIGENGKQNKFRINIFLVPVSEHLQLPLLCPYSPQSLHFACLVLLPVVSNGPGYLFFLSLPSFFFSLIIGAWHLKPLSTSGHWFLSVMWGITPWYAAWNFSTE